jgi:hypothetical protein
MHRNGIEWKNGTNILIEGNTWDGFWADVSSTGCAIILTPQGGNNAQIRDAEIRYNTVTNSVCFVNAIGGVAYAQWQGTPKNTQRIYIHDNVIDSSNGHTNYEPTARSSAVPFPFYIGNTIEDVRVEHNTVYDIRGPAPRFWHHLSQPTSGVRMVNNILWLNNDDGSYGAGTEFPGGSADPNCTGVAKAAMDCAWISGRTPEYSFAKNLLVPYYSNSSVPSGLVDSTTTSSNYSGTGVYVMTGATVDARLSGVGFFSAANKDFRLRASSAYQSGGASNGTDGLELGANIDALNAAQGKVKNVRVRSITGSSATIHFTAPDSVGCSVDYSTSSGFSTFTRISNTGGNRIQSVNLTGLSSHTMYYFRVNCAVEQPTGSFST